MSVQLRIGDALLHVADEFPEMGVLAPPSIGGTPVVLAIDVADAEAVFAHALAAGAEACQPPKTCSGVTGTAKLMIPSATAGTSPSIFETCRTTRSLPRPRGHSPEDRPERRHLGRAATAVDLRASSTPYRPWFENNRRLRELISELEAHSLQAAAHAEGWGEK